MQKAFFENGKSLSEVATYLPILKAFDLDEKLEEQLTLALENGHPAQLDFQKARAMGIQSYPTVIAQIGDKY
ncbi:thioredoxin, partial [Streptococcus suis]